MGVDTMDKLFLTDIFRRLVKKRTFITDGTVFRLHYQVTTLLLAVCCILVSTRQFIGDPIHCMKAEDVPEEILDTFCWVEGTFTLPKALDKEVGVEVVYPGVDHKNPGDETVYKSYYQWVCFTLLLQAILFYFPRLMWSYWEGGKIKHLIQGLNSPVLADEERRKCFGNLVRYFRYNIRHHTAYAFRYAFCELITLANVVGQIYLVDVFLGGEFTTYGLEVIRFSVSQQEQRVDPMIKVFPRLTKCTFHRYGSSGDVQKYDSLCLLPLNIVNEKIYILLWFWFLFLVVCTTITVFYRLALVVWPRLRYIMLRPMANLTPTDQLQTVLKKVSYGDWFVLFLLAENMDSLTYKCFLRQLFAELQTIVLSDENNDMTSTA